MKILDFLNGNMVFPLVALLLLVIYFINRVRTRRRFKR